MSGRNNMIIFEDESYIICHKRAGIPTQQRIQQSHQQEPQHERKNIPQQITHAKIHAYGNRRHLYEFPKSGR